MLIYLQPIGVLYPLLILAVVGMLYCFRWDYQATSLPCLLTTAVLLPVEVVSEYCMQQLKDDSDVLLVVPDAIALFALNAILNGVVVPDD